MSRRLHQPSGLTPTPSPKKPRDVGRELRDSGSLTSDNPPDTTHKKAPAWGEDESAAVVEYVALHHTVVVGKEWPTTKDETFWAGCSNFLHSKTGRARSGKACRAYMLRFLKPRFATLHDAEEHFNIRYTTDVGQKENQPTSTTTKTPATSLAEIQSRFNNLTDTQQWNCLETLFNQKLEEVRPSLPFFVPHNFLKLTASAMDTLQTNRRENTLFHLASGLGTPRDDGSGPRMPVDRMPFPLIEHNAKFFSVDHPDLLRCSKEYSSYLETMYAHFGKKWINLQCGPMWRGGGEDEEEEEEKNEKAAERNLLDLAGCKEVDVLAEAMKELGDSLGVALLPGEEQMPVEGGQMPVEGEQMPVEGGQMPVEGGQMPVEGGQMPVEGGQMPVEGGQMPAEMSASTQTPWLEQDSWEQDLCPSQPITCPCPATSTPVKLNSTTQSHSFYFTSVSQAERSELEEGLPAEELQRMHNILPAQQRKPRERLKTMDAKVNVAGLSGRTLRRKIEKAPFDSSASIQVSLLSQAHASNPKGRWWIKADACDLKQGLRESMRHDWSGDTDLGDGKLQELQKDYKEKQAFVTSIGRGEQPSKTQLSANLTSLQAMLEEHEDLLEYGLQNAEELYNRKQRELSGSEETLFALGWDVESYRTLGRLRGELLNTLEDMISSLARNTYPSGLVKLREQLQFYFKGVYSKKREAASHLLIFMISDEQRAQKPYAIPVRMLPCRVVKDAQLRTLKEELRRAMEQIGMVVVGFVTDGEWNSLRTMGNNRPVSIIQLMMEAKAEARSLNAAAIKTYLTLRDNADNPLPVVGHEAVPLEDVVWLATRMRQPNMNFERAIRVLRRRMFPFMYDPHPWTPGRPNENTSDCLKSIMAQYIFRKRVNDLRASGVDFSQHLYVPEVSDGEEPHFDREDHGHVLKRLTATVRTGKIPGLDMRRWVEALQDPNTMLTYTALAGKRKQSVNDCERMYSIGVVNFFKGKGYNDEARFTELVLNWHKATDGRGINQQTRRQYNLAMLHFLLEDWMPYHTWVPDYAMMDVNRPIKGIKGLTREVVVALVCNIESQEQRRTMITTRNLPPEHPRAGTSDDVEAFIATLHGMLGPIFDHKTFKENNRKICHEYAKKLDSDLPFYYHTGANERFKGQFPSFDQPSGTRERLDRIKQARFSDPGIQNPCRVQMPRRGARTIRARYHNPEEQLPPPPQPQT